MEIIVADLFLQMQNECKKTTGEKSVAPTTTLSSGRLSVYSFVKFNRLLQNIPAHVAVFEQILIADQPHKMQLHAKALP
jgi:hypothetical protein